MSKKRDNRHGFRRADSLMLHLMILALLLDAFFELRARLQPALLLLLAITLGPRGCAQTDAQTPPTRRVNNTPLSTVMPPKDLSYPYAGLFCGMGASTSALATKPTFGCGAGFSFLPLPVYTEVGVMGPQAHHSDVSGYVSVDLNLPLAKRTGPSLPTVFIGYSRLFETGHAFDYGLALTFPSPKGKTDPWVRDYRLELRDYYTFANPNQHNVMLRLGFISPVSD